MGASFSITEFSKGIQYSMPEPGRAMDFSVHSTQSVTAGFKTCCPVDIKHWKGEERRVAVAGFELFSRKQ